MIIKALIVSLSLISWTHEISVSGSVGYTKNFVDMTYSWHDKIGEHGVSLNISGDYFFTKRIGLGINSGFQLLEKDRNDPENHNYFISPYLVGKFSATKKFFLLPYFGISWYHFDFLDVSKALFNMGLSGRYVILKNYFVGSAFDIKIGEGSFAEYRGWEEVHTELIVYPTLSFVFGFFWPGTD